LKTTRSCHYYFKKYRKYLALCGEKEVEVCRPLLAIQNNYMLGLIAVQNYKESSSLDVVGACDLGLI
jgi:hypothetical protein